MTRPLLAFWLVLMQLLSAGAAPLYLCLDSDGSVGIDLGPSGCGCCHDEHEDSPAFTTNAGEIALGEQARCDCAHIQISPCGGPVICSLSVDSRPDVLRAAFQSPLCGGPLATIGLTPRGGRSFPTAEQPGFSARASQLSSVALRC
jgi:hypothetical protein